MKGRYEPDHTRVTVYWCDIATYSGWRGIERDPERVPVECATTGYLVRETKRQVEVAHTMSSNNECADVTVIPRAVVRRIERLK